MGNSPVDKGKDFIKKGMTLITETSSDRLLRKAEDYRKSNKPVDRSK